MPSKKFEAFVELEGGAGTVAATDQLGANPSERKRTLRSASNAAKRSKNAEADAVVAPLATLAGGNCSLVEDSKVKPRAKGKNKATSQPTKKSSVGDSSCGMMVNAVTTRSGATLRRIDDVTPRSQSKRSLQEAPSLAVKSKRCKRTSANQVDLEIQSPMTRSRSQSLAMDTSPATKIGQIFTLACDDIISEVTAAIHLSECPKAMLINKAWYTHISPRIIALGPLRERRWLAAEMKPRRAQIGAGLIERLDNNATAASQGKLTFKMHSILIDWLVDVAIEFRLSNTTLALTSSILDRFLALHDIEKKQLQLLGVTCMWIASKMEEVSVPLVSDFAWITYDTYTVEELRVMERRILIALGFSISQWIPINYINLVFEIHEVSTNEDLKLSISYIHELVLHEPYLLLKQPDELAAAICYTAIKAVAPTLHERLVSQGTIDFMLKCNYEDPSLQNLMHKITKLPCKAILCEHKWQAVLTKYRKPLKNNVACRFFGAPELPDHIPNEPAVGAV